MSASLSEELEGARAAVAAAAVAEPPRWSPGASFEVNPSLAVLPVHWRHLAQAAQGEPGSADPVAGDEVLLVWRPPWGGRAIARAAHPEDLLALKLVAEGLAPEAAAAAGPLSEVRLEEVLHGAADQGLLLAPRPLICRGDDFPRGALGGESFRVSPYFTLQWHVTQACDLRCRHCYDRSERPAAGLDDAVRVLDDLRGFCRGRRVRGAVSFSGGNPLLHPQFTQIYRAAAQRGFALAILGNPAPRARLEELIAIRAPRFFQVSLEGLPAHNDWVRGAGHFERTVAFLALLRELGVSTMVMLTLTADNVDQVLPLAARLRGLVDDFHFNRLALVGEGATLRLPGRGRYERFLEEYGAASARDPALGLKDNLINLLRLRRGEPPFGGCTGCGCGAAFNFLALLPDGEAHACRKFPSPVGNVVRDGLAAVYDSPAAARYREGCAACRDCAIRPVCGGCLAVTHGCGLDPLRERDPFCFAPGT